MMRPLARRLLPGSVLASDPNSYYKSDNRGGLDHTKGIKLRTVSRTVNLDVDDSSSTKNLADVETGSCGSRDRDNKPDFRVGAVTRTVIVGPSSQLTEVHDRESRIGTKGIRVKNDLSISYERI